jgi:hypothetical protein
MYFVIAHGGKFIAIRTSSTFENLLQAIPEALTLLNHPQIFRPPGSFFAKNSNEYMHFRRRRSPAKKKA